MEVPPKLRPRASSSAIADPDAGELHVPSAIIESQPDGWHATSLAIPDDTILTHRAALAAISRAHLPCARRLTRRPVTISHRGAAARQIPRAAPPASDAGADEKAAHVAEVTARRDEMVAGCVSCTMPDEGDRGDFLADVALAGRSVQEMGEGSSVRVLVVGAETGKLAKSLMDRGASHVLVIDHSQVRHP